MEYRTRKVLRLQEFDYRTNAAYFITVCTAQKTAILGEITLNAVGAGPRPARADPSTVRVTLHPAGQIVQDTWFDLPNHIGKIELGPFIVMPDHIHGIVFLIDRNHADEEKRAGLGPAPTAQTKMPAGLPEVIRQLKTFSARKVNQFFGTPGRPLWQRGYYECVIRNTSDFEAVVHYIENNPAQWAEKYPYLCV